VYIEAASENQAESRSDEPFLLCLLGDFSGSSNRPPLSERKTVQVDRDNFDEVLSRCDVSPVPGMRVMELDDFHPDSLYRRLAVFEAFRSLRQRLQNSETFSSAAAEVLGEPPRAVPADPDALLDMLISDTSPAQAPAPETEDDLQRFVRETVRPYLVPRPDPRAPELVAQVDEAAAGVMRAILHAPRFQSLEAAWRTVFSLIRRLDTGPDLKVYLLDLSKDEITTDPAGIAGALARRSPRWSLLAASVAFGASDLEALTRLATIAGSAGASLLGEADVSLPGESPEWAQFRRTAAARRTGLALPRILLRLPYGTATTPCEHFRFEELPPGKPKAGHMLWGSPAPFCAMLIAEGGCPGVVRSVGGLPVYVYREEDDEITALPCAEVEITEDTGQALLDSGIMPVVAVRGTDEVRILRFQSVSDPPVALPGPWS
jgi:type VI secretion system protein ImpC